jgi:hypothetical protein
MITLELDIANHDLSQPQEGPSDAVAWAESFDCTAVPATTQSCPGGTSYRVTGTKADLRRLLTDGGYLDNPDFYPELAE